MEQFKTPLQQSNAMLDRKVEPFNTKSISQKKWETPDEMFDNHRIVQMSPNDYFKFAAHFGHYKTPEALMKNRAEKPNEISVDDIQKMMREGKQFDTPWLRLGDRGEKGYYSTYWQEGLHRMLAAGREYGMDTKFPVYIGYEDDPWNELETMPMDQFIDFYENKRQKRYDDYKRIQDDENLRIEQEHREDAARFHNIPVDQLTEQHIKAYDKYLDDIFEPLWK